MSRIVYLISFDQISDRIVKLAIMAEVFFSSDQKLSGFLKKSISFVTKLGIFISFDAILKFSETGNVKMQSCRTR